MDNDRTTSTLSLRAKLVLSYTLVILGTVLVLSLAVSLAVKNYLYSAQVAQLRGYVDQWAHSAEHAYSRAGGNWGPYIKTFSNSPSLIVIVDKDGNQVVCALPNADLRAEDCSNPTIQKALDKARQGQEVPVGDLQIDTQDGSSPSLYMSVPLRDLNNNIIGAMFLSTPQISPSGDFMRLINQALFLSGLGVALVAALFSLLLVQRMTRPLRSLTRAAEQMKEGHYTQRVEVPKTLDELGALALTFNEMANTIETDVNELRRQDQVRRDLIANIAHDLATPLTAIQGLSEALADDVITEPTARHETAQRIQREVQRLQRLVAEVKQMSSLEAGHAQLDLAPLDMHALITETLAVIAPECQHDKIVLDNEIDPATPSVFADSDRITQVLLNLLDNARRHTLPGGKISVGAQLQGKQVRLRVSDTGVGIDPADLPHIFERFYRADRSRATSTGGSGLGLSIVKAIVTAHGGTVWAESTPGKGTSILFTLPIAQELSPASTITPVTDKAVQTAL